MCTTDSRSCERVQSCPDKASPLVKRTTFAKVLIHCDFPIILVISCENFNRDVSMRSVVSLASEYIMHRVQCPSESSLNGGVGMTVPDSRIVSEDVKKDRDNVEHL